MPYSCQLQFGTSGKSETPVGAGSTCRAIGLEMSQTSRLTVVQTTIRLPPGSLSFGRSTMAEYLTRSRGMVMTASRFLLGFASRLSRLGLRLWQRGQLKLQHANGVAEVELAAVALLQLERIDGLD